MTKETFELYELIKAGAKSYYIDCPSKIGLYLYNDKDAYLIDSGNDKDAGKKVRQILERNDWELKAIINTHSHADHIGGNKYLQANTGCRVYAAGIESGFIKHPILEPSFLYGGYPFKELRHKFLMAQESAAEDITFADLPEALQIIPLDGHCFHMIGIKTDDNIVYLADCVSSKEMLDKYLIPFVYDVEAYLCTLDKIQTLKADLYIPAHAPACGDITEVVAVNRDKILQVAEIIVRICASPASFEEILQSIFNRYDLTMNFEQYVLAGSTVRSYLSWLKDRGEIIAYFKNNQLLWKSI